MPPPPSRSLPSMTPIPSEFPFTLPALPYHHDAHIWSQGPPKLRAEGANDLDATVSLEHTHALPPSRCFKRAPAIGLGDAIRALLSLPAPPTRPDLLRYSDIDEDDIASVLRYITNQAVSIKKRPAFMTLSGTLRAPLTDDEVQVLIMYKSESPFPVYKWLNAWLTQDRRDPEVVDKVGPLFTHLYRAQEKLPQVRKQAARAVIVHDISALRSTFDNYKQRLAPGSELNFWGFSSFSADDNVINSEVFSGKPHEDAIIFQCGELTGVDMEAFNPGLASEEEILPLAPAIFRVLTATKYGHKVFVAIEQLSHAEHAYVVPRQ